MIPRFRIWWRALRRRARFETELDEEMRFHVESRMEDLIQAGIGREEALRRARIEFGCQEAYQDSCRESQRVNWIHDFVQDARYALRMFAKNPGFAAVALLTLALGIGANTAIFSLVDAILLRQVPVQKPGELERFSGYYSNPMYRELRERNQVFSGILARQFALITLVAGEQTERGVTELVSGNYFSVLGVPPEMGRVLEDADDGAPMSHPVAVVSHRFWQRRLAADPGVVGKTIRINDYPFKIVGVAPASFTGVEIGSAPDLWVPIAMQPQIFDRAIPVLDNTGVGWLQLLGRRKPEIREATALAGINVTIQQIAREGRHKLFRNNPNRAVIQLSPGGTGFSQLREQFGSPLALLMTVVFVVLLIACMNLAALLLARSATRRREIAVRLALGAGRLRLMRQLVTESLLLSALGGALGILLCHWSSELLLRMLPARGSLGSVAVPFTLEVHLDLAVLGFAFAATLIAGFLFGLAPAIQATRPDVSLELKDEGAGMSAGKGRFRLGKALVLAQVALSLLLLVGAGLFLRSLRKATSADIGLRTENVLTVSMNPELSGYSRAQEAIFMRQLVAKVQALPGVLGVAVSEVPLLTGGSDGAGLIVPGMPLTANYADRGILLNRVTPEFFRVTGGEVLRGRNFGSQDTATSPPVAIITEKAAAHFFPGMEPVGKRVRLRGVENVEIIGIARDSKYESVTQEMPRIAYTSLEQDEKFAGSGERVLYLQTQRDPRGLLGAVRGEVEALDKNLPLYDVKTLAEQKAESLYQERLVASLSGFFGALALLLAAIGLYGVMAYGVNRRTREIGIRMSLGAARSTVLWMVLRDCLALVLAGIAFGVPLSLWLSRLLRGLLFGVEPADPAAIFAAILLLLLAGALAGFLPSYRASRVDPVIALRHE